MSNRFVQYQPLGYKPVTLPLELIKETINERRQLIDVMDQAQDQLALIQAKGIPGTGYEEKAAEKNRQLQQLRDDTARYFMENPTDLYGQKRKLREVKNTITNDMISGELGAINNAYESYAKKYEELQKEAGKKDSYSTSRLSQQDQIFRLQNKNLGKFDPVKGNYENAASLGTPVAEFNVYERLSDVLKNTPELVNYDLKSSKEGWQIVDRVTGVAHKDSKQLVSNMLNSLKSDSHYLDDLDWQARYMAATNELDMSNPDHQELLKNWKSQKILNDASGIAGYAYTKEMKPDINRIEDPALKIQLQREKLEAMKKFQDALTAPDLGAPPEAEVDFLSTNSGLEESLRHWNGLGDVVNEVFAKNKIFIDGPRTNSITGVSALQKTNKLDKINSELSEKLNISKSELENYIKEAYKKNPNINYYSAVKSFVDLKQAKGFSRNVIKGYEIPFNERKDRTIDLVSNPNYRVYVVKNGILVKDGRDYTMGNFKEDYKKVILGLKSGGASKNIDVGVFQTTHFVPPSKQIPEYTYKMVGPDGETIYVAPTKKFNSRNQSTVKDYHKSYNDVQENTNADVVLPTMYDSSLINTIEFELRKDGKSLRNFGDPRFISGVQLVPSKSKKPAQNGIEGKRLYSKVNIIYADPRGNRKIVPVYTAKPNSEGIDLDEGINDIFNTLDQELYTKEVGTPKRTFYKGQPIDYMQLSNIFN